jgi:hypothetical protein
VATANAIQASGVLVRREPAEFFRLLQRQQAPLVPAAPGDRQGGEVE